jgi:transposase
MLDQDDSLSAIRAGEAVVPACELSDAPQHIRERQRMLGKKNDGTPQRSRGDRPVASMDCALPLVAGERRDAGQRMSRGGALAINGSNQAIGIAHDAATQACE